jgi:hypothetical protein
MNQENDKGAPPMEPTKETPDEGFLGRWSRRKSEAARDIEPTPVSPPVATGPDESAEGPEKVLTDEDMPPIEELGEESDYSGFLSSGVSDQLRKTALKKLFHSAKFNVCDGLDDYAEDYTKFEPLGDIVTADMKYEMKRAMEKALEAGDDADAEEHLAATTDDAEPTGQGDVPDEPVTGGESQRDPEEGDGERGADDARLV